MQVNPPSDSASSLVQRAVALPGVAAEEHAFRVVFVETIEVTKEPEDLEAP